MKKRKEKKTIVYNDATKRRILLFFDVGEDFHVILKKMKKYAGLYYDENIGKVYIDKDLPDTNKIITLVHELIHWKWKLDHNGIGAYCGYYSTKHDHLSECIASIIFKKKMVWED